MIIVTAKDLTREDVDRLNGRVVKVLQKGAYQRRDLVRDIQAMIARQVAHSDSIGGRRGPNEGNAMPRLLYVEDNEMNRDMLSRRLQRRGFEVLIAGMASRV